MELKQAFDKLILSLNFKNWKKENKDTYFSYAFRIPQEMPNEWQLGFYNKANDRITTFVMNGEDISIRPEEEVFKKEGMKVYEVNLDKVKITFENAMDKASEFQADNYPKDKSLKTIAILQNIDKFGIIWNITYITEAFNTLNMKIDASNGKVIEHNLTSIISFRKE